MKTPYFISFIIFLSSSTHRQPLGRVLQKIGSATVLKPIKIYLQTFSIHILFFRNIYHLNSKSKENFLNIEVYGVFLLTFILYVFKNKRDSLGWCS